MKRILAAVGLSAAMAMSLGSASAQDWPQGGPITIVVPFLPGAGNDLLGRMTAEYLTGTLGQQVSVENVAGGGSAIGLDKVAKSTPDGYTLLWSPSDGMSILPAVRASLPYKVPEDFEYLARIVQLPFVVAVHPDVPANNIDELIAHSKANPGRVRYGSSGVGGAPHMGSVLFGSVAGVEQVHVPYSGISAAVADLIGGNIEVLWLTPTTAFKHHEAGTIRVIAQTGADGRHPLYPDIATLRESGVDMELGVYYGMMVPTGTPEAIVERLRDELGGMLRDEAILARLNQLGYTPAFLRGDDFKAQVVRELEQWRAVAAAEGIKLED